ncbi:MAG: hypothetical protein CMH54_10305 [Myxococcales bacterium]|nr:hypothetical protein [Myxococcales bacterium]
MLLAVVGCSKSTMTAKLDRVLDTQSKFYDGVIEILQTHAGTPCPLPPRCESEECPKPECKEDGDLDAVTKALRSYVAKIRPDVRGLIDERTRLLKKLSDEKKRAFLADDRAIHDAKNQRIRALVRTYPESEKLVGIVRLVQH